MVFLLVFFRITGVMLSAPLFSNRSFPVPVRMWFAIVLALMMFPLVWGRSVEGTIEELLRSELSAALVVLSEFAIGWSIGWIASIMVFAMQLAGHLLGQEIGFSIGEVFDPVSELATCRAPVGSPCAYLEQAQCVGEADCGVVCVAPGTLAVGCVDSAARACPPPDDPNAVTGVGAAEPVHDVVFKPFAIDRREVSVQAYWAWPDAPPESRRRRRQNRLRPAAVGSE